MCEVCPQCPFREESKLAYDADAMEALLDGAEPSCHAKVGLDAIFAEFIPIHRCHGHDAWIEGKPGFKQPTLTES